MDNVLPQSISIQISRTRVPIPAFKQWHVVDRIKVYFNLRLFSVYRSNHTTHILLSYLYKKKIKLILGIPYSDASTDPNLQNFAVTGENSNSSSASGSSGIGHSEHNCHCSLNAMVICQQCGAFTHEDCQKQKLCVACVIR